MGILKHDWELFPDPLDGMITYETKGHGVVRTGIKKSDVYVCKNCSQICLAEIGQPPDETVMGTFIKDCATTIIKNVMNS